MINIFVVWKNDLFIRTAEAFLSQQNIHIAATTSNHETAFDLFLCCLPKPDILLLDINWGNDPGIVESVLKIFRQSENLKVIMTATFFKKNYPADFKDSNVKGFFYRTQPIEAIIKCIVDVYNGAISFPVNDKNEGTYTT